MILYCHFINDKKLKLFTQQNLPRLKWKKQNINNCNKITSTKSISDDCFASAREYLIIAVLEDHLKLLLLLILLQM